MRILHAPSSPIATRVHSERENAVELPQTPTRSYADRSPVSPMNFVRRFVSAASLMQVEDTSSLVIHLPPNVRWLDLEHGTHQLFVRDVFWQLFARMNDLLHQQKLVRIAGGAGIGKTAFLSWLVLQLRRSKPAAPCIVLDLDGFYGMVTTDGTVYRGKRGESFEHELENPATWLLSDALHHHHRQPNHRPTHHGMCAKQVWLLSPLELPMDADVLVLPPWTLEELEHCRASCFSHIVSTDELQKLYALWGGNPRFTLAKSVPTSQFAFMDALEALTVDVLQALVMKSNEHDDDQRIKTNNSANKRMMEVAPLLPVVPTEPMRCSWSFCSTYVVLQLIRHYHQLQQAHEEDQDATEVYEDPLEALLASLRDQPQWSIMRAQLVHTIDCV